MARKASMPPQMGRGPVAPARPEITVPNSTFVLIPNTTLLTKGEARFEKFTIPKRNTFLFRFVADYAAQAAIITPDQLEGVQNKQRFTGFGEFDRQTGTFPISLRPGDYYLIVRNSSEEPNEVRVQLDHPLMLPTTYGIKFHDFYIQRTISVEANGGKYIQPFTIQAGFTYFLNGCNSGLEGCILQSGEQEKFLAGQPFYRVQGYHNPTSDGAFPGPFQLKLAPGEYALAFRNQATAPKSATFTLERWQPTDPASLRGEATSALPGGPLPPPR